MRNQRIEAITGICCILLIQVVLLFVVGFEYVFPVNLAAAGLMLIFSFYAYLKANSFGKSKVRLNVKDTLQKSLWLIWLPLFAVVGLFVAGEYVATAEWSTFTVAVFLPLIMFGFLKVAVHTGDSVLWTGFIIVTLALGLVVVVVFTDVYSQIYYSYYILESGSATIVLGVSLNRYYLRWCREDVAGIPAAPAEVLVQSTPSVELLVSPQPVKIVSAQPVDSIVAAPESAPLTESKAPDRSIPTPTTEGATAESANYVAPRITAISSTRESLITPQPNAIETAPVAPKPESEPESSQIPTIIFSDDEF